MPTYANITPQALKDGILYANQVPLTSTEADLYSGTTALDALDPIPIAYNEAILAIVQMNPIGITGSESSYVVMQTDMGDGTWVDVAWCVYTNSNTLGIFVLSAGIAGATSVQNTRTSGTAPSSNGANQIALGGRVRFVGKATLTGGSSSGPGGIAGIYATIYYKLLGLR